MKCSRCGSTDIRFMPVNETQLRNANRGCMWWTFVGWWWIPVKWIFLTVPALLAKIFIPKKQVAVNKRYTVAVCQRCGHSWRV